MKRMKRFVFGVEVEVWVLVWDENDDVSFCKNSIGFFLVAENMTISIFDITYGKFAWLML